ncbi:hypothetical protein BOW53_10330 [Solemya pervernicosa gill symbiont]|uniref:CDP-alcohol phosphatidyltransferase n=2 Tax=Gammaproteobacteria incertae sedis TaxID=118884 RepID=A0A1T2L3T0_9GAMM|nr:CDP-alcohol phosphatidyltransferase family protein [Candidatus Reidiella endopervernicosa]OOZ39763.1 hypothetical protein BOW53_10330 [Solemya pervernicosa gill symbiont]QKQ27918.1 CDP-alcohol phosphatidyltransferase family protein [Candidatus Reidiella endopervernicosa]
MMTIPNMLSMIRIAAVPLLLWLAATEKANTFLTLLIFAWFTDILDGYIARRLNQVTELGTRLDSWGDLLIYLTLPICTWLLWPELVIEELFYLIALLACFLLPHLAALMKFRSLTSYHTWADKLAALILGFGVLLLFFDITPILFRVGVIVVIFTALEEIAITLRLKQPRSDIRSLWHLIRAQ